MIEGILPGGTTLVFNDDLCFYLQAGPDGCSGWSPNRKWVMILDGRAYR
jgi:hypothetical protein